MKQLVLFLSRYCFARTYRVQTENRGGQARAWNRREQTFCGLSGFWLNLILALTVGTGLTISLNNNTARAQVVTPAPLENSIYDSDTFKVADQLQCPVCQGVTVAYSNSGLAQQMRLLIKKKLETGENREQILQYFVDRYGESILTNPPKSGFTLLVWLLPIAGLLVGAGTVGYALRSWKTRIRSRAGRLIPETLSSSSSSSSEVATVAGTGNRNQPAKIKEGSFEETLPLSYTNGLEAEKLQQYQARVEAELATFAYQEEWGKGKDRGRKQLLPLEPGKAGQLSLSREQHPTQTPARKINPLEKG